MRLTMNDQHRPEVVRRELEVACAHLSPDHAHICPAEVWKALLSGRLDDELVAAEWGDSHERRRLHRNDDARLAFDAAAAALVLPGPWLVPWAPQAA